MYIKGLTFIHIFLLFVYWQYSTQSWNLVNIIIGVNKYSDSFCIVVHGAH